MGFRDVEKEPLAEGSSPSAEATPPTEPLSFEEAKVRLAAFEAQYIRTPLENKLFSAEIVKRRRPDIYETITAHISQHPADTWESILHDARLGGPYTKLVLEPPLDAELYAKLIPKNATYLANWFLTTYAAEVKQAGGFTEALLAQLRPDVYGWFEDYLAMSVPNGATISEQFSSLKTPTPERPPTPEPLISFRAATDQLNAFALMYISGYAHKDETERFNREVLKKRRPELYEALDYYLTKDPEKYGTWETILAPHTEGKHFNGHFFEPLKDSELRGISPVTGRILAAWFLKNYAKDIERNGGFSPAVIEDVRPDVYQWFQEHFARRVAKPTTTPTQEDWDAFFSVPEEPSLAEREKQLQGFREHMATYTEEYLARYNPKEDWPLSPIALAVEPSKRHLYRDAQDFLKQNPDLDWEDLVPAELHHKWRLHESWGANNEYLGLIIGEEIEEKLLQHRKKEDSSERIADRVAKNWPEAYAYMLDEVVKKYRRGQVVQQGQAELLGYISKSDPWLKDAVKEGVVEPVGDFQMRVYFKEGDPASVTLDWIVKKCAEEYAEYQRLSPSLFANEEGGPFREHFANLQGSTAFENARAAVYKTGKDPRDFLPPGATFDWDREPDSEYTFTKVSKIVTVYLNEWADITYRDYAGQMKKTEITAMLKKKGGGQGPAFHDIFHNELFKEVENVIRETEGTKHDFTWRDLVETSDRKTFWENSKVYDKTHIDMAFDTAVDEWAKDPEKSKKLFFSEYIKQKHPELYEHVLQKAQAAEAKGKKLTWRDFIPGYLYNNFEYNESFDILSEEQIAERDAKTAAFREKNDIAYYTSHIQHFYSDYQKELALLADEKEKKDFKFNVAYIENNGFKMHPHIHRLMQEAENEGAHLAWHHFVPEELWSQWDTQPKWYQVAYSVVSDLTRTYLQNSTTRARWPSLASYIKAEHPFCYDYLVKWLSEEKYTLKNETVREDLGNFLSKDPALLEEAERAGIDLDIIPKERPEPSEAEKQAQRKELFLQKHREKIALIQQLLPKAYVKYEDEPPQAADDLVEEFGPVYLENYIDGGLIRGNNLVLVKGLVTLFNEARLSDISLEWADIIPTDLLPHWHGDPTPNWRNEAMWFVTGELQKWEEEKFPHKYRSPADQIRATRPYLYHYLVQLLQEAEKKGETLDLISFARADDKEVRASIKKLKQQYTDFSIVPDHLEQESHNIVVDRFLIDHKEEIKEIEADIGAAYQVYVKEKESQQREGSEVSPFGPVYIEGEMPEAENRQIPQRVHALLEKSERMGSRLDGSLFVPVAIKDRWSNRGWREVAPHVIGPAAETYGADDFPEAEKYPTFASYIQSRYPFCYEYLVGEYYKAKKEGRHVDFRDFCAQPELLEGMVANDLDFSIVPGEKPLGFMERHFDEIEQIYNDLFACYEKYSKMYLALNPSARKVNFGPVTVECVMPELSKKVRSLIQEAQAEGVPLTWSRLVHVGLERYWREDQKWEDFVLHNNVGALIESFDEEKQKAFPSLSAYIQAESPLCFDYINQKYRSALHKGKELDFRDFTTPDTYKTAQAAGLDFSIIPLELEENPRTTDQIQAQIGEIYQAWLSEDPEERKPFNSYTILHADSNLYIRITRQLKGTRDSDDPLNWMDFLPQQCWEAWPVTKRERITFEGRKEKQLESFLGQVANKENQEEKVENFRNLLDVFGGSLSADVLTRYLPEYKAVPQKRVKSLLGNYLGPYLLSKRPFSLENLRRAALYAGDITLKEQFAQVVKEQCLASFKKMPRTAYPVEEAANMQNAVETLLGELNGVDPEIMEEIGAEVREYYRSLYENVRLPENMVGEVRKGRPFPDFSQRINIKEIQDKRRILIADDPGMGKSASAIMSKEHLGAKTALVVIPSNVIGTWQRYLTEQAEGGYFKAGQGPKVLTVESPEQLKGITVDDYDYILLSHERLNDMHTQELSQVPYDFLIVDEVHKLKNLKDGVRSSAAVELAAQVEQRNGYLALLSGTPVPNKIEDLAILLKLLYSERYANTSNAQLVSSILNSDILDLRTLLLARMQMKKLEDVEDMPPLAIHEMRVTPSDLEKELYEAVMNDEEVTVSQKLMMLRRIVLNPPIEEAGSKTEQVASDLREFFAEKDRAVLFVNGYVDGVIRGEHTILEHFNLPSDVEVVIVDGSTPPDERKRIEKKLHEKQGKMLLVVSGQTADVGVDYSPAEKLLVYNEPWTKYDLRQQIARVYRPPRDEALDVNIYISEGTIEEGMHSYIETKEQAVEKLLNGIPVSDTERELLTKSEQQNSENLEVNAELSEYYYTSWDKMRRIFGYVKDIGADNFAEFLKTYGEEYATCYESLGDRSYQANANRVLGTLIEMQVDQRGQNPEDIRIGDIGSGPEMLRVHMPEVLRDRVISMDMNQLHLNGSESGKALRGSFTHLPFQSKAFDYLSYNFVLHYSELTGSSDSFERLEVLAEANRVLKEGGRLMVNTVHTLAFKNPARFKTIVEALGYKWVEDYTGKAQAGKTYSSDLITLEKVSDTHQNSGELVSLLENAETVNGRPNGRGLWDGLKFRQMNSTLQNPREIIGGFELGNRVIDIHLNEHDSELLAEEREATLTARKLIVDYRSIDDIPQAELQSNGYTRYHNGRQAVLFKKLENSEGGVTIKG